MPPWLRRLLDRHRPDRSTGTVRLVAGRGEALRALGAGARDAWRLMTCVSGDADHLVEGPSGIERVRLPPGRALLVVPGCVIAMGRSSAAMLNLLLDEDGIAFHHHRRPAGQVQARGESVGLHRIQRPAAELGALCRLLAGAASQDDECRLALFRAAWAVAIDLARRHEPGGDASPLWRAARDAIDEALPGELGRDQLAAQLGVHPSHLSRVFRREAGMGVGAVIVRRRLALALELLRDPDRPVADAARAAGFSSHAVFAQACRRVHGATPTTLRASGAPSRRSSD